MDKFRVKCNNCKTVLDVENINGVCSKCGGALQTPTQGQISIYRMGSPIGIAVGYGLYLNGEPYGHIANKELVKLSLPFGTYNLHCTCGLTRRCQDLVVELTPENPIAYVKARIKAGFWTNKIIIEKANKEDMP